MCGTEHRDSTLAPASPLLALYPTLHAIPAYPRPEEPRLSSRWGWLLESSWFEVTGLPSVHPECKPDFHPKLQIYLVSPGWIPQGQEIVLQTVLVMSPA